MDKPLETMDVCVRCGRAKNQHRAFTSECPQGRRTPTGYRSFSLQKLLVARDAHDPREHEPYSSPTHTRVAAVEPAADGYKATARSANDVRRRAL